MFYYYHFHLTDEETEAVVTYILQDHMQNWALNPGCQMLRPMALDCRYKLLKTLVPMSRNSSMWPQKAKSFFHLFTFIEVSRTYIVSGEPQSDSVIHTCVSVSDSKSRSTLRPHGPGSSVHGTLQARTLEWVAISSSRGSCQSKDWTLVSLMVADSSPSEPYIYCFSDSFPL